MELFEFISLLNKRKQTILIIALLTLLLAMVFTLVQPLKYSSNLKVLVIQNFSANTDPYTASKSNEYLSNVLARVIYSSSFYANILASDFNIDKKYFSGSVEKQMKKWAKTIDAKVINDSGIINISVYHSNRSQAEQIAKSIGWTLQTKNSLYHGGGNNVKVKIIDEPITNNFPVKPNIILNLGLGLIVGLFLALSYIYLFPEERFNIVKLFEKNKKIKSHTNNFLAVKNNSQELKIKNNWQIIGNILGKKFVAPVDNLVEEKIDKPEVLFEDKAVEDKAVEDKAVEDDLLLNTENNFVNQPVKNNFINNGDMRNIFGKPYSDDL